MDYPKMFVDATEHGVFVMGEQENDKPYIVAHVYYGDEDAARLFAASGKMYEALEELADYVDDFAEASYPHVWQKLQRARAALAAAKPEAETTR